MARIKCDHCELMRINGVICHELGCPNTRAKWIDGAWIKFRECRECGCDVPADKACDCCEPVTDDLESWQIND